MNTIWASQCNGERSRLVLDPVDEPGKVGIGITVYDRFGYGAEIHLAPGQVQTLLDRLTVELRALHKAHVERMRKLDEAIEMKEKP